ncbi:MAG TPA: tetratricopeptide repeat protein, partial [Thermoanaerobaculia bacterium]|nr:tetratricopeptide repeat protein [Thermoanaerobaculia bacterium]
SRPPAAPTYPEMEAVAEEAAQAAAVPEEFDLDLDDVFVLDIEDEAEPASLVKPPADMLDEAPRRPAWAQAPEEERAEPAAVDIGDDTLASLRPAPPPALQAPPPAPAPPTPPEALPETPLELDLDDRLPAAAFELELDLEPLSMEEEEPAAAAAPPPVAPAPPAALVKIDPELLERTAAELHPPVHAPREEDLVTEAEVLAKYGLEEKALERLREALRMAPRHLGAHALMIQINLDKGRHGRVLELANQMSKVAAGLSDRDPWLKVRRRLLAVGFRLDGDQVAAPPQAREAAGDGVDELLRGILGKGAPKKPAPARPAAPAATAAPAVPTAPPPQMAPPPVPAPLASAPPAAPPVAPASPPPSLASSPPAPAAAIPISVPPSPPPPAAVEPPPPSVPSPALPPVIPIVSIAPGEHFNLLEIGKLVEAEDLGEPEAAFVPEVPPPPAAAKPGQTAAPRAPGLDDTGMSWLDEVDSSRRKRVAGEEDFFDLAGELEQELSREEGFHGSELLVQPAEQSLEQIVEGFKKGVAENLSPTDYDTHFNLGIAYREMGLLDEAIGEFQLAAKAPELLVACCSMLGLCFLDKGLPELAIKWYRRGLESPRASEDDSLGLLYDMGNVYESLGDIESAYKTFVEIYGVNTNYRDVVARIEELGRSR